MKSENDISTDYCGLKLRSPVIVGSCPLTMESERVRQMTIAGAGAVVLPSLFEEQVVAEFESAGQAVTDAEEQLDSQFHIADENRYNFGVDEYLRTITRLKHQVGIPIIASLNGCTAGRWLSIGAKLQSAGADAVEVAFESSQLGSEQSADECEEAFLDLVTQFCDEVSLPVAVKLSQFHTNIANLSWRLMESGAAGIVCFGFEPTWHVSIDRVYPAPCWNLTGTGCINQTVAGLAKAAMSGVPLSLAASGGINSTEECIRVLQAGASVAMVTSEIYRSGPDAIAHIVEGLTNFLGRNSYSSLSDMLSKRTTPMLNRRTVLECIAKGSR